jgi:hypothetical protein
MNLKELEEDGLSLIEVLSRHSPWRAEEYHSKHHLRIAV